MTFVDNWRDPQPMTTSRQLILRMLAEHPWKGTTTFRRLPIDPPTPKAMVMKEVAKKRNYKPMSDCKICPDRVVPDDINYHFLIDDAERCRYRLEELAWFEQNPRTYYRTEDA